VLLKDEIKNLSLKQLQDWFGFTHKEVAWCQNLNFLFLLH
jgi:hypothetical protein